MNGADIVRLKLPSLISHRAHQVRKGSISPQMHRAIMMFKAWLRGTHHAVEHLQAYLGPAEKRFFDSKNTFMWSKDTV